MAEESSALYGAICVDEDKNKIRLMKFIKESKYYFAFHRNPLSDEGYIRKKRMGSIAT